jgi:uncharacterized protein (TIGR02145 family)
MRTISFLSIAFMLFFITGCGKEEMVLPKSLSQEIRSGASGTTTGMKFGKMTDIDGNVYKTIQIGKQIWMAENLRVSRFRNGDPVDTYHNGTGFYYYNNDSASYNSTFGKMYDIIAVGDARGLAPKGWHIPKDYEWEQLSNYLGGNSVSGKKLKSKTGWDGGGDGTDEVGFNGQPAGWANGALIYFSMTQEAAWWTSTTYPGQTNFRRFLHYNSDAIHIGTLVYFGDPALNYIRCVKD